MGLTVARLRLWIIGVAVLLVAVIAVFLGYARYKVHRLVKDLPERLGAEIERSSNGFTYSQSIKGRPAFTIHAAKAVQYTGGVHATLHDVSITMYGPQGDRSDRIYGSEFDYDQKTGLVTAKGDVQIDLAGSSPPGTTNTPQPGAIHIKTSGLVFDRNSAIASTSQYVEFQTPKGAGHSTGGSYDSKRGVLILNSGVELSSSSDGNPVLLHASHAQFLRDTRQAFLLNPVCDYQKEHTLSDQAIVYLRPDGSAERINAQGHIHLKTDTGQELTAQTASILLDEHSQPQRADAAGGLYFFSKDDVHQMHGNAVEGSLLFSSDGALAHAQARNAVSLVDQELKLADDPGGSATREMRAAQVDVDFITGPDKKSAAKQVLATGGAAVVLHTIHTKAPAQNATIKADKLLATLANGDAITGLHGDGHTSVTQINPEGANSTSTGDTLDVAFTPAVHKAKASAAKPGQFDTSQIQSAVQQGNVTMTETPAQTDKNGAPGKQANTLKATAQRAEYDAARQLIHLQGSPHLSDGSIELSSNSVDYFRETGKTSANGEVKATYLQSKPGDAPVGIGGSGPAHVVSSSATLDRAQGQAVFQGQARLWQGANSVAAPVIELSRPQQTLKAHGDSQAVAPVSTVITSTSGPQHQEQVFHIRSRDLAYSDQDRRAVFTGSVTAQGTEGTIHSDKTEVFLAPAQAAGAKKPTEAQSQIDHILATGHVVLQQPNRRATGEKLLYTGQDGKFVLTGSSAAPPRLSDQAHGAVTGASLIFNTRDDSVSVNGGQSNAVTDTRVPR